MSKKITKCIACDGRAFSVYGGGLVSCAGCNLVVAEEIPNKKEIADLYQKKYFFGMEYFDYEADRPALEYNFRKRIKALPELIHADGNVIEIGSAYGYFLNLLKDRTKSHLGFDVTEDGVKYAKELLNVNATTDDFMKYKISPNSVDSVFMWDVAEHLTHPEEYFKKVGNILKPGGHVAITTGNVESIVARVRRDKWRMVHPPTHVYYFSPKTLTRLLNKYGLEVISVRHRSVSRNVGSVFNQLIGNRNALKKNSSVLNYAYKMSKLTKADRLNIPINTFDIMEVVARKA